MSRWTIRLRWAWLTASHTSRKSCSRASTVRRCASQCWSIGTPSTCSITRYGRPSGGRAAVEQAGDVRVLEPRQDLALRAELPHALGVEQAAHHLDGDLLQELVVVALGQVDGAHAALAEHRHELVGAQALERRRADWRWPRPRHRSRPTRAACPACSSASAASKPCTSAASSRSSAPRVDERRARVAGAGQRRLEELLRRRPAFGGHAHASLPRNGAAATPRRRCRGW